jgi:hypothetical protein
MNERACFIKQLKFLRLAGFVEAIQNEGEPIVAWVAEPVDSRPDRIRQESGDRFGDQVGGERRRVVGYRCCVGGGVDALAGDRLA